MPLRVKGNSLRSRLFVTYYHVRCPKLTLFPVALVVTPIPQPGFRSGSAPAPVKKAAPAPAPKKAAPAPVKKAAAAPAKKAAPAAKPAAAKKAPAAAGKPKFFAAPKK